jgi:hypothetical protein
MKKPLAHEEYLLMKNGEGVAETIVRELRTENT